MIFISKRHTKTKLLKTSGNVLLKNKIGYDGLRL